MPVLVDAGTRIHDKLFGGNTPLRFSCAVLIIALIKAADNVQMIRLNGIFFHSFFLIYLSVPSNGNETAVYGLPITNTVDPSVTAPTPAKNLSATVLSRSVKKMLARFAFAPITDNMSIVFFRPILKYKNSINFSNLDLAGVPKNTEHRSRNTTKEPAQ